MLYETTQSNLEERCGQNIVARSSSSFMNFTQSSSLGRLSEPSTTSLHLQPSNHAIKRIISEPLLIRKTLENKSIHIQTIPPHLESMSEPLCMRLNATLQTLEPELLSTNNCMGIKPSLPQRLESSSKNSSTRLETASQAQPGASSEASPTFPRSRIPLHSGQSSKNSSS